MSLEQVAENTKSKKNLKEDSNPMAETQKETHTVIRTISQQAQMGAFTVQEVDTYLNSLLSEGWKIINTHYIGNAPEGWIFAWMLVR